MSSLRPGVLTLGAVVIVVTMSMIGFSAQAIDPVEDWRQSKIAFDSERDGNFEIYVMNADGSNQDNLTNYSRGDQFPAWSPDGKGITFTSWGREDGLRAAIFAMDPDGSNVTRLSKSIGKQDAPRFPGDWASFSRWSPDGKRMLFLSSRGESVFDIFVMDADGSNVQRLSTTPGAGKLSEDPDWSPDGNLIAFNSNRDGSPQIYVMATDGSNVKRLTDTWGSKPRWSPDGQRILFTSTGDRRSDQPLEIVELYVMNADGSNVRRLTYTTDKGESSFDGVWSPDGRKIAFVSGSGATSRAAEETRDLATTDVSARWFASREIYVMDVDGSNMQRLTFNDAFDGHPQWRPTRR